MKAAVVPAVSSSGQIQDVPQAQPGPNQVLIEVERVVWRVSTQIIAIAFRWLHHCCLCMMNSRR